VYCPCNGRFLAWLAQAGHVMRSRFNTWSCFSDLTWVPSPAVMNKDRLTIVTLSDFSSRNLLNSKNQNSQLYSTYAGVLHCTAVLFRWNVQPLSSCSVVSTRNHHLQSMTLRVFWLFAVPLFVRNDLPLFHSRIHALTHCRIRFHAVHLPSVGETVKLYCTIFNVNAGSDLFIHGIISYFGMDRQCMIGRRHESVLSKSNDDRL